jgi:hypothetical protein
MVDIEFDGASHDSDELIAGVGLAMERLQALPEGVDTREASRAVARASTAYVRCEGGWIGPDECRVAIEVAHYEVANAESSSTRRVAA